MRPILLGMNNPHSTDPTKALLPTPNGSAGHRLWKLSGYPEEQYLFKYERVNLVNEIKWEPVSAKAAAVKFSTGLSSRTVVVLGFETWKMFGFPAISPCDSIGVDSSTFYFVPHPSGRNLWYNEDGNQKKVRELLRRLA